MVGKVHNLSFYMVFHRLICVCPLRIEYVKLVDKFVAKTGFGNAVALLKLKGLV